MPSVTQNAFLEQTGFNALEESVECTVLPIEAGQECDHGYGTLQGRICTTINGKIYTTDFSMADNPSEMRSCLGD